MNPLLTALVQAGLMDGDDAARIERQLDDSVARQHAEAEMLRAFSVGLSGQRDRLIDAVRATDGLFPLSQQNRLWAGENERLWASVRGTLLDVASEQAVVAAVNVGGVEMWNLVNQNVIDWAETYYIDPDGQAFGSIPNLNLTSRTAFQRAFVEWQRGELQTAGLADGLPMLIRAIEPTFGAQRSSPIAITETSRLFAMAELQAARANPFVTSLMWETSVDERVCFPAGTMVATESGARPIEKIEPGAMVWTRQGLREVRATSKRRYTGTMTTVQTAAGNVTATASHPFWTLEQGWLECGNLTRQHTLQTFDNKPVKVFDVFNFGLADSADTPAVGLQKRRLANVPLSVTMPVIAVDLKSNTQIGQQEVYAVSSHFGLLDKGQGHSFECLPDCFFEHILAAKTAVASEATKLRTATWHNPKLFAAMSAYLDRWWASAFLRAIVSVESLVTNKGFTAAFASEVFGISGAALVTANGISVGILSGNRKGLAARWTNFADHFGGGTGLVTSAAAKSTSRFELRTLEWIAALFAEHLRRATHSIVASHRAILSIGRRWIDFEGLGALNAGSNFHDSSGLNESRPMTELYHKESLDATYVYDLEVEDAHEFYANGILVHNCPICQPRHGTVVGKESDGFRVETDNIIGYPPAHTRCRCRAVSLTQPALEALRAEGFVHG